MAKDEAAHAARPEEATKPPAEAGALPIALEYLEARGLALDVLRRVFLSEPERAFLDACQRSQALSVFACFEESKACVRGMEDVGCYFDGHDPVESQNDFDELHADYTRLFVGPRAPMAPLWASYYLEPEKLLFQQTTLDVRNLYRTYGLVFDGGLNEEADDHLGLELDFLFRLNARMARMAREGGLESADDGMPERAGCDARRKEFEDMREVQRRFVGSHMRSFAPAFEKAVAEHSSTGYYQGFARILVGFLEIDAMELGAGHDDCRAR